MNISKARISAPVRFTTRFYGSAKLGVGKYEEAMYAYLSALIDVELTPIQPFPVPDWLINAGLRVGRDLRAVAKNLPFFIPPGHTGNGLVHLSNEVLAPSLLFHRGPSIITVHHLPPIWERSFRKEAGKLIWLYVLAILALRRATRLIVDSQWTASELRRRTRISASKIDVIPLGVDHEIFKPTPRNASMIDKYGLGKGPHILYTGGFGPRKNVPALIKAFTHVRQHIPTAELILVGPVDLAPPDFVKTWIEPADGCRCLGYVPVADLAELYNLATVFVMPSKLEGFGFPVLEAMACGCPVIAASGTALPELAEGAGMIFDPDNSLELAEMIRDICENPVKRESMAQASLQRADGYGWQRTAELTVSTYQRVLRNR